MEITTKKDMSSGGITLTAGKGRKKLRATVWYSPKMNRYLITGDINRKRHTKEGAIRVFVRFVRNPDRFD